MRKGSKETEKETLNERLLNHDFGSDQQFCLRYSEARIVAAHYAVAENAIAVLSNMPADVSYICYGRLGEKLGIGNGVEEVESIWEKKLLERIQPDDVAEKIAWELQFIAFMKQVPADRRADYYLQHFVRIRDAHGNYVAIRHRIFYLDYDADGNVRLTLCLYTAAGSNAGVTGIVHSLDDTLASDSALNVQELLSQREREVLSLIARGKASKQIADALCISVNTVNNHRQNILRKLHCQNTAEAVVVAGKLGALGRK